MTDAFCRRVRRLNWMEAPDWLVAGEAPSDCLYDLRTRDNDLSVWVVDSPASLERVAVAVTATTQRVEHFDYLLFEPALIDGLGISLNESDGGTPDLVANRWHRDLVRLSAPKPAAISFRLWNARDQLVGRIPKPTVEAQLLTSVSNRTLDWDRINPELQKMLERRGAAPV